MARPCKIPTDPDILDKVIENLALGLPVPLISDSIGVNENTIYGWKRRPDFKGKLAVRTLEILSDPARQLAKVNPGLFLQTHPATRETHAPPVQKKEVTGADGKAIEIKMNINFINKTDDADKC